MGSFCSLPIDCLAQTFWRNCIGDERATYVRNLKANFESLKKTLRRLLAKRDDILSKVDEAEQIQQLKRRKEVDTWLSTVADEENEVAKLIDDGPQQIQKLCFGGCCSTNCISSYKFGKNVARKLKTLRQLIDEGDSIAKEQLVGTERTSQVDLIPMNQPVGLNSTFDRVWSCIQNEHVGIIGLYGLAGVGKTTLLKLINNKFADTDFVVIWVVASRGCKLEKVQEDIGKRTGVSDNVWESKSYEEKAKDIYRVLGEKKFALLLDDIWERVDLIEMGIPRPNKNNGSKIIFTTRSFQVCGQMEASEKIMVQCLAPKEAFELFRQKVGEDTLASDPKISELAKIVAEECGGLPLVLVTVARAMTGKKTPEEWDFAIEVLKKGASEISGMGNVVYPRLKFSYDYLPSEAIRSCFLYCSLFPEDFSIPKDDLIDYWNCEGFLGNQNNKNAIRNCGFNIIGILLNACLLEEDGNKHVKMHDVTRDVALWIASVCHKDKHNFVVRSGIKTSVLPLKEEWEGARRVSLMWNDIEYIQEAPTCSNLLTLFLCHNELIKINGEIFRSMSFLTILDLSDNSALDELPWEVSKLVLLKYLNLSGTSIKKLPIELKALVELRYLNVEFGRLEGFPMELVSSFSKLQTLRMMGCLGDYYRQDDDEFKLFCEELQRLKHLNTLTISMKSHSAFQTFLSFKKLHSFAIRLSLDFVRDLVELNISALENMEYLELFGLWYCYDLQCANDLQNSVIRGEGCFNNLRSVIVSHCGKLVDLTWLILAPNLTRLDVSTCDVLEHIINSENLDPEEIEDLNPFAKLEFLRLEKLPKLQSIYRSALSFPHLKELHVTECEKLKKLPVDSNSEKDCKLVIRGEVDWWEKLEWEDEATRICFEDHFSIAGACNIM